MNSFIENEDIESRYGEEIYEDFTNYQKLQARIDKAIEHLTKIQKRYLNNFNYSINDEDLDDIMQILKGEENE